ncbi:MAG: tetratricopeptide repeat protein [Mariprofundaceae bacterium]
MNDKGSNPGEIPVEKTELEELQRDMRAAAIAAWAKRNQQALIAGALAFVLALAAAGLWLERDRTRLDSAASLYQQAQVEQDRAKRQAMLTRLSSDFAGTPYAIMAEMQLAALDAAHAEAHLKAVVESDEAMPEWIWQARLDLAALRLAANDKSGAQGWLAEPVGMPYRQLRQYLLAQASDSDAERKAHLEKALDAESHDEDLKARIERELNALAGKGG